MAVVVRKFLKKRKKTRSSLCSLQKKKKVPRERDPLNAQKRRLNRKKCKILLPEQTWLSKKPYETKTYRATIPRQLAEVFKTELGEDLNIQERTKTFSATRSPSLEKDDKSPFVNSATCDKSDVFAFEPDKIKRFSTGNSSTVVETKVQPQNKHGISVLDRNFNNNVTPIFPKVSQDFQKPTNVEHLRTSSLDADNENIEKTNLKRFRSVNTCLNTCSTTDVSVEIQQERLEMQNSPRILECSSATDKSTKFNFSPKLLGENQNSPKFFTPTEKFSPRFFPEGSPKSVYYDSVRSPKFFPDSPKSPAIQDERSSLSPKAFADQNNRNSPKLFALEQHSPRILSGKPRSPKIYSANKENYFDFDSNLANIELTRVDEIDNSSVIQKPSYIQRYGGRKSIERERVTVTEKLNIQRYRRHNSCDTYNQNIDSGNTKIATTVRDNADVNEYTRLQDTSEDVLDCCVQVESLKISPTREVKAEPLKPHTQTAQQRRQRLKSISLDSDNARIIEQNLGLPIAKHMIQDNLDEALQDYSSSCCNVKSSGTCETGGETKFTFDRVEILKVESKDFFADESKYSPDLNAQKKSLRDASDTKSFIDMPRFSPKEFEVIITVDDDEGASAQKRKVNRNPRNLTIDLTRKDSDLEKELLEFEKLYTNSGDKKVRTPTLKIKAISLDSSESMNLSLPQSKALEVPQNSVSVPNTPKRQLRILSQKNLVRGSEIHSGGKMGYNSLQSEKRRFMKWQPVHLDSGIFLKENHANLMLYQPTTSWANTRRMGSFDENIADFVEHPPEINVNDCDDPSNLLHQGESMQSGNLGSNLLSYKQNLSVSSTNLKTLPENVPSNDFGTTVDEKVTKKFSRRGSNQSLKLSFDQGGKYSTYSRQSLNCSLSSAELSGHNLASIRNSASNFSLNTDNRQKILERRNSNTSIKLTADQLTQRSNVNIQASNANISGDGLSQPAKNCLLQRRGSNNSLTLNIQNSSTTLARFSSNSSLNINKDSKSCHRKGLLERRSSNTSLTLNINSSNPQLATNRGLSISNYNLNGSSCNLNTSNSNQNISNPSEPKKGILERRSSNTSLTINIQNPEVPRDIEVDEKLLELNLKYQQFIPQRDNHRKSLSTENLIPKSYKNRNQTMKNNESIAGFGSHDDLWSDSYVAEATKESYAENLTYVGGDPDNEIIYAFGMRQNLEEGPTTIRNITTKPLSPQTTSEDFKTYLANIQHLQNASSVLTRKQLKDLNSVFQNGYSTVKCDGPDENGHRCSPREPLTESSRITFPETELPCFEYQKLLLRNLHKEFWDLPSNFQEKPLVFGSHPKNRYKTILPNEHSRFILRSDIADAGEGYVNANFIKGHDYTKNSYIATQGPLQNTIYDFWSMVHQNSSIFSNERNLGARPKIDKADSNVNRKVTKGDFPKVQKIVMLTNFIENNRQKCEKYFPVDVGEEMVFVNPEVVGNIFTDAANEYDNRNSFLIRNKGTIKNTGYTIRRLQVCYRKVIERLAPSSESGANYEKTDIEVYHYWFHNWADHKCPKDVNALLNLSLDILDNCSYEFETSNPDSGKCRSESRSDSLTTTKFMFPPMEESTANPLPKPFSTIDFDDECLPPTIVHCSAGIGRTGCLIAILNGIKQLNCDQKVDILGIVCNMRLNRGGMVQTSEQYELVHKVMCLYEQFCLPSV